MILSRVEQARGNYKQIYFQEQMQEENSDRDTTSAGPPILLPIPGTKKLTTQDFIVESQAKNCCGWV